MVSQSFNHSFISLYRFLASPKTHTEMLSKFEKEERSYGDTLLMLLAGTSCVFTKIFHCIFVTSIEIFLYCNLLLKLPITHDIGISTKSYFL